MIASLAMYDWPELRAEHDRLWGAIREALAEEGIAAPPELTRGDDLWRIWTSPGLVLGQTCGMPYRMRLHGRVEIVATPDYGLPEAPAGHYYSVLVVRRDAGGGIDAFLDGVLAFNSPDSQSGYAAVQNQVAPRAFRRFLQTGSHRASAEAVAAGRADIAAIDAVTWRLIERFCAGVAGELRILARTAPTPGLPLITARGNDAPRIARAVGQAVAALAAQDRAALGLRGIERIPTEAYLRIPTPPPAQVDAAS
ncbi:phosphate/phosphite/phosphonate ABC transporter substrate-binding protein [Albidovulum sp.]